MKIVSGEIAYYRLLAYASLKTDIFAGQPHEISAVLCGHAILSAALF
jgi:hypothetical protein